MIFPVYLDAVFNAIFFSYFSTLLGKLGGTVELSVTKEIHFFGIQVFWIYVGGQKFTV